ncbi:hypothetical protein, partial [Ruminococcus flavefaciens]|uniref:hypothetical protein n=1 Tax=Ruminococcus flavefaciens TaxID=1265 RepID=UPI003F0338A2
LYHVFVDFSIEVFRGALNEPMNGIPKGLCSFGRVTPHKMGRCPKDRGDVPVRSEAAPLVGCGAKPRSYKALRKGEFQKQSSGLFLEEGDSPQGGEMSQRDRGDGPD